MILQLHHRIWILFAMYCCNIWSDVSYDTSQKIPFQSSSLRHTLAPNALEKWKLEWLPKVKTVVLAEDLSNFTAEQFNYEYVKSMLPNVRMRPELLSKSFFSDILQA